MQGSKKKKTIFWVYLQHALFISGKRASNQWASIMFGLRSVGSLELKVDQFGKIKRASLVN
jgi:hypothetical protein